MRKQKNKIQRYLHCTDCIDEELTPNLGIGFDDDECLVVVCQNHEARLQEFKLKQPAMVDGDACCADCVKGELSPARIMAHCSGRSN